MKINIWWVVIIAVILFALLKQCEGESKTVTKTITKVEIIHDTIKQVKIDTIKQKVYVKREITKEGKEIIVYKDKPSEDTINASKQSVEILSNDATAKLSITHTGELLDVQGIITYPKITETIKTTITRDASGLFIYGQLPVNNLQSPEVGVLVQIKNKMFISGGVQYNNLSRNLDYNIGVGVKIW